MRILQLPLAILWVLIMAAFIFVLYLYPRVEKCEDVNNGNIAECLPRQKYGLFRPTVSIDAKGLTVESPAFIFNTMIFLAGFVVAFGFFYALIHWTGINENNRH